MKTSIKTRFLRNSQNPYIEAKMMNFDNLFLQGFLDPPLVVLMLTKNSTHLKFFYAEIYYCCLFIGFFDTVLFLLLVKSIHLNRINHRRCKTEYISGKEHASRENFSIEGGREPSRGDREHSTNFPENCMKSKEL